MPTNEHMTTAEVAAELGCDVTTVNRKVKRGELTAALKAPGLRGAHLFTRDEIDRYKADRDQQVAS